MFKEEYSKEEIKCDEIGQELSLKRNSDLSSILG